MTTDRAPWELATPSEVLRAALAGARAGVGDVVVARVALDTQRVTGTRTLQIPPPSPCPEQGRARLQHQVDRRLGLSELVRTAATQLAPEHVWRPDGRGGVTGVFITLVCREGRVVDTLAEWQWLPAWRYANHFRDGFDGDVYVVTPHGWTGVMDRRCGEEPALHGESDRPALRAV